MSKWRRISRERVFDHKFFKVNKDIVELPNGEQIEWIFWDAPDSSMVVAETEDKKLVMIHQYRYLPDEIALEFPSGGSKKDESLKDCAKRELEEETGYTANEFIEMGFYYQTLAQLNRKIHIFYAPNARLAEKREHFLDSGDGEFEDIEVVLTDPDKLIADIHANKLHSMPSCFAYFLYQEFKNKNA